VLIPGDEPNFGFGAYRQLLKDAEEREQQWRRFLTGNRESSAYTGLMLSKKPKRNWRVVFWAVGVSCLLAGFLLAPVLV
jgi:hypothetical protein